MLSENKNNGDRFDLGSTPSRNGFDKFLKDSLKQYRPPVPADFSQRILSRLEEFEKQKALRKVVWQERLLLAACILLPIAGIILVLMFPNILQMPAQLYDTIYLLAQKTAANIILQWQLWTIYAAIAAFVLYAAYEVLLADN
ncbi:MAG: hypothetical protein ABSE89_06455 [Sedimentisphaerales bacterium]